jgi:hypothetical protein
LFLVAVPVSILSVIAALFINQVRLRTSNTQTRPTVEAVGAGGEDGVTAAAAVLARGDDPPKPPAERTV